MPDDRYYLDDGGEHDFKKMMDAVYTQAYPLNAAMWTQGAIDKRFKVGDQSLWSMVYGDNQYYQGKKFFFNLIRRHINMIAGYQRRNRKSTIALPSENADEQLADDYTASVMWSERRDGTHEYLSQAFEGALDVGISLMHMYPDYTMDPISGDLFVDNVSYNNFLIDPHFRKQDLSDCNFIWRRRWVTKEAAKALLPGRAADIDKMKSSGMKDGKFPLQAEMLNLNSNRLMPYDEFHYRSFREATIVLDPKSGESYEWEENEDDSEDELEQTLAQQPWLVIRKIQKPTVKLGICLAGKEMYHGPNLLGVDMYPFVPVLAYHEPDVQSYPWRIQGVIRNLRDAQYLYNRRKVIELDILESQINSGWIFPVDALTDQKALRQTGQGFLVPLKKGHTAAEIERIAAPDIPASMIELSRSLAEDISAISGVNEELLGSATDDKAGILSALRQGAGLTTLQTLFDKLDYSQRLLGKLRMAAIRKNFSKGKVRRILGREPNPKFFLGDPSKYDMAVEEGVYTTTQKQMELQQLLHFREIGMPIPDESILRAANIQNKQQLIDDMQQAGQAQQQQEQAMAESQQEQMRADNMLKAAKTRSELAKSKESMASAAEKAARIEELQTQSEQNKAKADLDIIKQLIELEDMDLASLRNSLEMAEMIKGSQQEACGQIIPLQQTSA